MLCYFNLGFSWGFDNIVNCWYLTMCLCMICFSSTTRPGNTMTLRSSRRLSPGNKCGMQLLKEEQEQAEYATMESRTRYITIYFRPATNDLLIWFMVYFTKKKWKEFLRKKNFSFTGWFIMIDQKIELYTRARKWAERWKRCIHFKDYSTFLNCVSKNCEWFYVFFKLQGNFVAQIMKICKIKE